MSSRVKLNEKRRMINKSRKSRINTFIKKVLSAIDSGDKELAKQQFITAQPEIQRGVTKGVLHKNTAARRISRLSGLVKSM